MVLNFGRPKILVGFQFSSAYIVYIYDIYLKFWRYNSCIKICKMSHQIFYFLLFYTSLYIIQQTSFFTNFYNFSSLNLIYKKDFCHEFSFCNGSTETLAPIHLTGKSTKRDESFLLMLP